MLCHVLNCSSCSHSCPLPPFSWQMRPIMACSHPCSKPSMPSLNINTKVCLTQPTHKMCLTRAENPRLVATILKSRQRFEALRSFTLESGQEEIERLKQRRKEAEAAENARSPTQHARDNSVDALRSPASVMTPTLSNVPEEGGTFAIGDDDDSDGEDHESAPLRSPSSASNHHSRTPSASSIDSAVPTQLRGMSEKARGKMPVGTPTFSRVNSLGSISSHVAPPTPAVFAPSPQWVSGLPTLASVATADGDRLTRGFHHYHYTPSSP